ncbi:MAG TPA: membrane dipeptidase [bacterium]|nr:membrane dipeptidase [bacterium]
MVRRTTPIDDTLRAHAARVHSEAIVIDGMCTDHIPHPHSKLRFNEPYLRRLFDGGITAFDQGGAGARSFKDAVKLVRQWEHRVAHTADQAIFVRRADDIRRAKAERKVGVIIGSQDPAMIEDDTDYIEPLYRMGVRTLQVTYNERSLLGDGCQERVQGGLTDFGIAAIEEMNRVGLLVDVSHAGEATALEATQVSRAPVIISHSACRALRNNPRSASDELIRAMAKTGGVIGICLLPFLLTEDGRAEATLDDLLRHVDHVVDLVGVDHVGFGSDLTEEIDPAEMMTETGELGQMVNRPYKAPVYPPLPWIFPQEANSLAKWGNLTLALLARGYADHDVAKVMGGNWLRVYSEVWK